MSHSPEIALCVATYQRPRNLALVLESIAAQRGVDGKMEVVVTDDGSTDNTPQVVEAFRRRADFPVQFITHPHITFQLARCRNEAVAAAHSPYILILDGDCMLPPHHVATHLARRRRGVAICGDAGRLDRATSERVSEDSIRRGEFSGLLTTKERARLWGLGFKARLYNFLRHPRKPDRLNGGDFSIWREDYERVNGFDENFCGWGWEDYDMGRRLRRAGVRLNSVLHWTCSYHLWHPVDATRPADHRNSRNADYRRRTWKLARCRNGLVKRNLSDIAVRIVGRAERAGDVQRMIAGRIRPQAESARPEVELLFLPGEGCFSGTADCNVLVALEDSPDVALRAREANLVVAAQPLAEAPEVLQFPLAQWDRALEEVA
jgi:glycosyltransferase involved in cell wall biosynthesis